MMTELLFMGEQFL